MTLRNATAASILAPLLIVMTIGFLGNGPAAPNFGDPLAGLNASEVARFQAGVAEFNSVQSNHARRPRAGVQRPCQRGDVTASLLDLSHRPGHRRWQQHPVRDPVRPGHERRVRPADRARRHPDPEPGDRQRGLGIQLRRRGGAPAGERRGQAADDPRCSASAWSRPIPDEVLMMIAISNNSSRPRSPAGRASSSILRRPRRASAGSAGRHSTPSCSRSPATPTSTRWGSPRRSSRPRTARKAIARSWQYNPVPRHQRHERVAPAVCRLHRLPGAAADPADSPGRPQWRPDLRRDRLRLLPRADVAERAEPRRRAEQRRVPPLLRLPAPRHGQPRRRDRAGQHRRHARCGPPRSGACATSSAYLHDGRAATIPAAILAHDGQARQARNAFAQLRPADQARLVAYLNSL